MKILAACVIAMGVWMGGCIPFAIGPCAGAPPVDGGPLAEREFEGFEPGDTPELDAPGANSGWRFERVACVDGWRNARALEGRRFALFESGTASRTSAPGGVAVYVYPLSADRIASIDAGATVTANARAYFRAGSAKAPDADSMPDTSPGRVELLALAAPPAGNLTGDLDAAALARTMSAPWKSEWNRRPRGHWAPIVAHMAVPSGARFIAVRLSVVPDPAWATPLVAADKVAILVVDPSVRLPLSEGHPYNALRPPSFADE